MKKFTKTTIFGALAAAIIGAAYMALGKGAAKADQIEKEVDDEFDSLDTNEPTENDIVADVIEPEEAETEPEEV